MKIVRWIGLLALGASSVGVVVAQSDKRLDKAPGLVGTWSLESRRDRTSDGTTQIEPSLGETPLGLLDYDAKGHVAVQLMKRERTAASVAEPSQQTSGGTNSSSGSGSYDAYFGTYTVDGRAGTVTHHINAALAPADVGRSLTRHFVLKGDVLTLSFQTTVHGGAVVTRVIVWRRVA